ncbi:MAG: sigma-E processing peptidase SpoIIGA [Oscillospiraceae bacterium]|nr:sigma-E processing peptidase SpoIIGA [Oscillospiraceae bacterium]
MFINYLLLISSSKFLNIKPHYGRIIFSSFVGSLFSIIIFFPKINLIILFLIKILLSGIIVFISFGYNNILTYGKNLFVFFLTSFIFAGFISFIWSFFSPNHMYYNNGVFYYNISAITLVITTIICYFLIGFIKLIFNKFQNNQYYDVLLSVDGKEILGKGFLDTGNNLIDIFTGKCVVITDFEYIKHIIPSDIHTIFIENIEDSLKNLSFTSFGKRIKIIPYNVVNGEGLIISFKPDKFIINNGISLDVLVGVSKSAISNNNYNFLLNNNLNI